MAAPNITHQRISGNVYFILRNHLQNNTCDLFTAPFDVRLLLPSHKKKDNKIDTVVQPDLCVICDENKLDKQGCVGAPDLIVEILSPGNSRREMRDKFELYEEAGVLEYWIIDPERRAVFVYILDEKMHKFGAKLPILTDEDVLTSTLFEGLEVDLREVFPAE